MPQPTTPNPRTALLDRLRNSLQAVTVQDLRQAARLWGWPVKGTAKADIIEQLMEHLADPAQMAPAFRTLSPIQQQAMIWLAHVGRIDAEGELLRTVIGMAEGHDLVKAAATRVLTELRQRLLLLTMSYQGTGIPEIYAEWLPRSEAPGMAHQGPGRGCRPGADRRRRSISTSSICWRSSLRSGPWSKGSRRPRATPIDRRRPWAARGWWSSRTPVSSRMPFWRVGATLIRSCRIRHASC